MTHSLRQRIEGSSDPLYGTWLAGAHALTAEIMASSGYDWLLIDAEHGPNDLQTILSQLQAIAAYDVSPIVRPPIGDAVIIKQYLDLGVTALLCPLVNTAQMARDLVRACRYPPSGVRGVGASIARASRWNAHQDYLQTADGSIFVIAQAETTQALENLEEIASTDGVDAVLFGPADLSASMGLLGQAEHPDVQAAIVAGIATVRACGKAACVQTQSVQSAHFFARAGARLCGVGSEVSLLGQSARAIVQDLKSTS